MSLSTHVLDTSTGLPAAGMTVELAEVSFDGKDRPIVTVTTDADGRHKFRESPGVGVYRMRFLTGDYLAGSGAASLYPWTDVTFSITGDRNEPSHLHIPLLLSPYGYSTYRGS